MTRAPSTPTIRSVSLKVGLEVHVELATRTKMFSRSPNVAHETNLDAEPNSLIDPTNLGLPGALPVMNRSAVEMAMMVGLALGCRINRFSKWDRKGYFYPDLPKGYQISQYDLPLCGHGAVEVPALDADGLPDFRGEAARIGIIRAHLEEDAGKLLHEAPGGRAIDFSIVDLNRAGTPLLEIVTEPDFTSAGQVVLFARMVRDICRHLGVSRCVMQRGHIRFEPNINTLVSLDDGRVVATPIVEIKNLNSFRALRGAIEHELRAQPRRWLDDRIEHAPGTKSTRGWDDRQGQTVLQRRKEEAHDYRYFPDPDLPPVVVDEAWLDRVRARVGEAPMGTMRRCVVDWGLTARESSALIEEPGVCRFFEAIVEEACGLGLAPPDAARGAANLVLQIGARLGRERGVPASDLGIGAAQAARLLAMRDDGSIGSSAGDDLFESLCDLADPSVDPAALASERGLVTVRDEGALEEWCRRAIEANPAAADDVRAGKQAAIGRLIGAVMQLSGGRADAKTARERLASMLRS